MDTKARRKRLSHLSALISTESKRRLKRQSERLDVSMTAVLEELINSLPEEGAIPLKTGPGRGEAWLKEHQGRFAGLIKPEDRQRSDRFGDLLRKHVRP